MKRRVIALMICQTLMAGMLAGCASSDSSGSDAEETTQETSGDEAEETTEEASAEADTSDEEIVEIFWQYPIDAELPDGFYDVEDAINEVMEAEIGVHVTFVPTGLMDSQQDATLMVSTGEQLDVMLTYGTSVGTLVDSGLIMPLDDLVEEYGAAILEECSASIQGCYYDGVLYGVPTRAEPVSNSYGYIMKKSYADKYGFDYDDDRIYTMEEIEEMFAIVKEGEGENFYMVDLWLNTYEPLNYSYQEYDMLSGSFSAGVLMLNRDFSDLTIYNYFETEEYYEMASMMYRWAQLGYIAADAAIDTDYGNHVAQDNYLGTFGFCFPSSDLSYFPAYWGEEIVQFRTVDGFIRVNGGCSSQWNIPITSANPEKAMQAINLMMERVDLANLILYGFEGEEYEVVEEDEEGHMVIEFLADDISTLPFYNSYGLWGNGYEVAVTAPTSIEYGTIMKEYDENIPEERTSAAMGYNFVTSDVSAEIAAVEAVMEQYCYSFNAGAMDPDVYLDEFISALKAAGIDDIIAENQRQLDEWAANQQ